MDIKFVSNKHFNYCYDYVFVHTLTRLVQTLINTGTEVFAYQMS